MADIVQLVENGVKKYLKTHAKAVDGLYPIGAVFISVASDSPATLFGGTWERFGQGRVLVSVDENDAVLNAPNKKGGSNNPLTAHTHKPDGSGISGLAFKHSSSAEAYGAAASSGYRLSSGNLTTTGDNTNHNNWQPFITAYMWVRTA